VTALPTIATMIGANRVVRGVAITHPFGAPERGSAGERALRRHLVERAVELLETDVERATVWEAA
jgi:glycine reductase